MARWNKSACEFGVAGAFSLICVALVIGAQRSESSRPHVQVSGTLLEWQTIGQRKSPALRLRMSEEEIDFRIDPALFRDAMHRAVPPEFRRGARTSVLVLQDEYADPATPMLNKDSRIAWVRGLTVDDREIFGLEAARAAERENRRWSYVLLIASIGVTVYSGLTWRRLSRSRH